MIDPNEALRQLENSHTDISGGFSKNGDKESKWIKYGLDIMYDNAKDIIECLGKIGKYAPKEGKN